MSEADTDFDLRPRRRFPVEIVVNGVLLSALAIAWGSMTAVAPEAAVVGPQASALAALEDRVALSPRDDGAAEELAAAYLDAGQAGYAIAVLRSIKGDGATSPRVLHRLARAYEMIGNIDDAAGTAKLASQLCERAVIEEGEFTDRPYSCTPSQLAAFQTHERALGLMTHWGVSRPNDPLRAIAYHRARLSARVAEAQ